MTEPCPIARIAARTKTKVAELDDAGLDMELKVPVIDRALSSSRAAVKKWTPFFEILIGTSLVLHGGELETTLLFAQTLRQVGGPQLKKAVEDLGDRWHAASAALKEETPTLRAMHKAVTKLEKDAEDLRKTLRLVRRDLDDGIITKQDFRKYKKDIEAEFAEIVKAANRARASAEPLGKVLEALDLAAVRNIFDGAWQTVLTCVAAATANHAANLGIGIGLGHDLHDTLSRSGTVQLLVSTSKKARAAEKQLEAVFDDDDDLDLYGGGVVMKAATAALGTASRLGAIVAALKHQEIALLVSGASLGARLVVDGLANNIPILQAAPATPLKRTVVNGTIILPKHADKDYVNVPRSALTIAVAAAGIGIQLNLKSRGLFVPSPFRLVLAPAFRLDRALKRVSPGLRKKAPSPPGAAGVTPPIAPIPPASPPAA